MLSCCGLPTDLTQKAIDDAFATYRMSPQSSERAAGKAALKSNYGNRPVDITMIGVWDTVGSLGIPSLLGQVDPVRYGFLNTTLSPSVKAAYQAISIDERRKPFPPTLWEVEDVPGQICEQVWFSGCHSSVGGGCPDSGLSDITLKWMLSKCKLHGLEIDPVADKTYSEIDTSANSLDVIEESWNLLWGIPSVRTVPPNATIASTVQSRLSHVNTYGPSNLLLDAARALNKCYTVVDV